MKSHFREEEEEDILLGQKLCDLLGQEEANRLMSANPRPAQAMSDISRLVRNAYKDIDGSTRSRLDGHLDELNNAFQVEIIDHIE